MGGEEATALTLSVSRLNLCHLLNLFSNASDALRAARADGRHYVPLSLIRLGRVINTHGDILVSNAKMGQNRAKLKNFIGPCDNVDPAETRTPSGRTLYRTYEGYETSETCFGIPEACAISQQFLFRPKTSNSLRYILVMRITL